MLKFDDIVLNQGDILKYPVPTHLMGLIMGRQKTTLRRIIHQTSTEIEPLSWVEDGERFMGFSIQGSPSAIENAIAEMIAAIKGMDVTRAIKIIKGHIKPEKKEDNQSTKTSTGSKLSKPKYENPTSSNICIHFKKGNCRYGINCRRSHSQGPSN